MFQSQVIEFQWKDIQGYDVEEEGMVFQFEYNRPGKKPRIVQILTQYVSICLRKYIVLYMYTKIKALLLR